MGIVQSAVSKAVGRGATVAARYDFNLKADESDKIMGVPLSIDSKRK